MLGWLHAVPEGSKESRMVTEKWPMPEVEGCIYLIHWFFELGMTFNYNDLLSWSILSGVNPNPKEVDLLTLMTRTYSNSVIKYRSKEHNLIPPFIGETEADEEERNLMIKEKMMRSLARYK